MIGINKAVNIVTFPPPWYPKDYVSPFSEDAKKAGSKMIPPFLKLLA